MLLVITRLTIGGDTNVVLDLASHLNQTPGYRAHLAVGPVPSSEVDLTHLARERDIPVELVPCMVNHIDPVVNLRALAQLRSIIARGGYDIVHTHSSVAGVIGRMAAASQKVPVIVHHVHGWGLQEDMSPVLRAMYLGLERFCARFTGRMIAVSQPTIEKGLQYKICPESKFSLIYNGIPLQKFQQQWDRTQVRRSLGTRPGSKLVGMIGRLDAQKNPLDFIRAASLVLKRYPGVDFILVGDGALKRDCEALIRSLNLTRRVHLLGYRGDVDRILSVISVFALSSLWEGLPVVFQEAMSAGKPIVANDVDGACDVIRDGETGFLVRPRHPEELADRILRLLQNEQLCRAMGEKAREESVRFSNEKMATAVESLYQELLYHRQLAENIQPGGR